MNNIQSITNNQSSGLQPDAYNQIYPSPIAENKVAEIIPHDDAVDLGENVRENEEINSNEESKRDHQIK